MGAAETLNVVSGKSSTISLDWRKSRKIREISRVGIDESELRDYRFRNVSNIVYSAIVHGECGIDRQIVEICAKLSIVTPN